MEPSTTTVGRAIPEPGVTDEKEGRTLRLPPFLTRSVGVETDRNYEWPHRPVALVPCGDLVEGRVRNLEGLNRRCSLNHLRQARQHLRIDVAAIVVRVLFPIPQTDRNRFGAVRGNERNLVFEAILLPQQGQNVLLERLGKLTGRVGLQMHGHIACVHIDSLATPTRTYVTTTRACACYSVSPLSISRPCHRPRASRASSPSPSSPPPRTRWCGAAPPWSR